MDLQKPGFESEAVEFSCEVEGQTGVQEQVQERFLINNERPSQPRDTGMAAKSSTP